jgi:Tfp pilus assembly protein PilE
MKNKNISTTKDPALLPAYPLNQLLQKGKIILSILLACTIGSGCFQHYYKTNTRLQVDTTFLKNLKAENKYFIVHADTVIMGMQDAKLVNQQLEATLVKLPKERVDYSHPKINEVNAVKAKHQANTFNEVHIYTGEYVSSGQTQVVLPVSTINKIDVYGPDEKTTRVSAILSIVALGVVGLLIAGLVIIALNPPVPI